MLGLGKLGLFVGGVLFGTAGIAVLKSSDAKKFYTHATAAVMRGIDGVVKTGTVLKENCGDIYADASDINAVRYKEAEEREIARARAVIAAYEEKAAKEGK